MWLSFIAALANKVAVLGDMDEVLSKGFDAASPEPENSKK